MLRESHILLFSIFIAGLCSIVYELLIATTGAYFLGDSVTQFSITIGVYMAFMGVGSYLSKWVIDNTLLAQFIVYELMLALIGGSSVPLLYFCYAQGWHFQSMSIVLTALIGVFVGLEIPLLSRLMEKHYTLKVNLANVLSIDYLGALIATLVFPLALLPWLGVFKTSLLFGLINLSIALTLLWYFYDQFPKAQARLLRCLLTLVLLTLAGLMLFSKALNRHWNETVFEDRIVHSEQSHYQQLIMTKNKDDLRLYLNGGLQFSAIDEYRYHESLIHLPLQRQTDTRQVLILGGGDGLAARELLKYPYIEAITLVDLDPAVAELARSNVHLKKLNQDALLNPKVRVINQDAFVYLTDTRHKYDLIVVDLPDPKTISLSRLYSKQFYTLVKHRLNAQGIMVTQATSPYFAKEAFWSIHNTAAAAGFHSITPYHADIPSFGNWGFVMACKSKCPKQHQALPVTRFYDPNIEPLLMTFPADMQNTNSKVSSLDQPHVLYYYLDGWKYWN
ncbi:polyamine aminopropyltransferase [Pseudoalteromonas rubra]|uniref:Polyamine aminopropyltransferase n=1 Tax=Pseudoalteromonas rubra TaxID=43658 RepID=A0A0U2PDI4_9GAMM|nr:polyamine aminopropyltransferase [Pseudoalteromonas rubra]ALU45181.1 spermidine synthase [Pseudoalteromonas rubra]